MITRAAFDNCLIRVVSLAAVRTGVAIFLLGAALAQSAEPDLVNIQSVDPTILVDLRYAGTDNIVQRALYPPNMPALLRPSVAKKVANAQNILRPYGYGLKIWDAYRPKAAHEQLWQVAKNTAYVADPGQGRGSLHTWGVAVDATLVDLEGKEVKMPTDFDEFTPAAMLRYQGSDKIVRRNLRTLQAAMARSGFYGVRTEWWHFVVKDWQKYRAIPEIALIKERLEDGGSTANPPARGERRAPPIR